MKRLAIASLMAMTAFVGDTIAQDTASRVSIMAFNVENFFDNADDPRVANGDNAEIINTADWVKVKATSVARVIQRFDFGKGPDVVLLPEVESKMALEAIKQALDNQGAAYPTAVLIDVDPTRPDPKPDQRGIKVGLLSKLPLQGEPKSVPVDLVVEPQCNRDDGSHGTTRDLLAADLTLPDGLTLSLIGAHLPSGGNPRVCREIGAKTIAALAASMPTDRVVIAAGDFNFNCAADERKGLEAALAGWKLPPELDNGCRGAGSQYFGRDKTWSYLDVITQKLQTHGPAWEIDPRTFHVVIDDFEQLFWDDTNKVMHPKAFRLNTQTGKASGVSDHWPIAIDLVRK